MYNAFLVIRTVFFALLTYFHVLVLVFASWNIVAAKSLGMSAPGATVFLLIGSVIIFMLVPVAYLAEVLCIKARPAQVRLECAWTALMSLFQLAASIDATVNGPPMHCQMNSPWAICASSSLLVHISWLLTLIIFTYFLALCITAATHAASLPDIWVTPIPHVPWFGQGAEAPVPVVISHLPTHKKSPSSSSSGGDCAVTKYIAEQWEKLSGAERQPTSSGPILFQSGRQSGDPTQPTWAREQQVRRGVDSPFARPPPPKPKELALVVAPPPRTYSRQTSVSSGESRALEVARWDMVTRTPSGGSHGMEIARREMVSRTPSGGSCAMEVARRDMVTRTPSGGSHGMEVARREMVSRTPSTLTLASQSSVFPRRIANPDLPIPHPNSSQWIRADAISWVSLRTQRSIAA